LLRFLSGEMIVGWVEVFFFFPSLICSAFADLDLEFGWESGLGLSDMIHHICYVIHVGTGFHPFFER